MRKIKLILLVLTMLSIVSLTSCNKVSKFNNQNYGKIKYYVAGLYIQVNEYDEYSIDDPNPKIYFDFSDVNRFGVLKTKSGTLDAAMNISNLAKNVKEENGINKYYMNATINFVNPDVNKIKLFLIYVDKDNVVTVNEELSETINLGSTTSYDFINDYTNNKVKYQLQMKLIFK